MRRLATLVVALGLTGCGGTLVLETRTEPVPPPPPAPAPEYVPAPPDCCAEEIDADEAVAIVTAAAAHNKVWDTRVRRVQRYNRYWKIELFGETRDGAVVRVRAKVDRGTGDILSYHSDIETERHDDDD